MWMIHLALLEIFVILQSKEHQGDALEQDINNGDHEQSATHM
jgi:hypothetical protein